MSATVSVLGVAASVEARVARVSPAVDPTTLLGTVRIALDASAKLPIGSAGTARIVTGKRQGVAVPANALRRSMTGSDEVVVCDKGVARVRGVTLGVRDGATVEIATGLAAGEAIVVDHVLGLDDGQPLAKD
jgi:HlyD family secretion protein